MKTAGAYRWARIPLFFAAGASLLVLSFFAANHIRRLNHPLERVVLANGHMFLSAPVYVAQENGYFKKEGLELVIQEHTSGRDALQALLDGKADFAISTETSLIQSALGGNKIQVLATIASSLTDMAIIHSRGKPFIPKDPLTPYRIGTVPNTNTEYFLELLFLYKGWDPAKVQVIPVEVEGISAALQNKKIDAAILWEPQTTLLQQKLGNGFAVKHEDGIYSWTWNLAGTPETIKKNHQTAVKILRALQSACRTIHRKPEPSRNITAAYLGIPENSLEPLWQPFKFSLSLTQETLLNIEAQIRWRLAKESPGIPFNALDLFVPEPLRELDHEAVTFIQSS